MKEFKNSTKTQYTKGGDCGCGPKGAAKTAQVMRKFKTGGAVSSRPATASGRQITDEELSTPARILAKSGRADPYERMPTTGAPTPPARKLGRGAAADGPVIKRAMGGPAALPAKAAPRATEALAARPARPELPSQANARAYKKGGMSVMPRGKKC